MKQDKNNIPTLRETGEDEDLLIKDSSKPLFKKLSVPNTGGADEIARIVTTKAKAVSNPSYAIGRRAGVGGMALAGLGLAGYALKDEMKNISEATGHWRQLPFGGKGKDKSGSPTSGRTWVNR